jgi:hypothetical protein
MKKFLIVLAVFLLNPFIGFSNRCNCIVQRDLAMNSNRIVYDQMINNCFSNRAEQACYDDAKSYNLNRQVEIKRTYKACCASLACCK